MPFEFGASLSKERTQHTEITSELWEGALPVDYYPNRVPAVEKRMQEIRENPQAVSDPEAEFEQMLFSVVASWDVTNAGAPVPLTHDGLASIGVEMPIVSAILQAVVKEAYAGEASGTRLQKRLRNS